MHPKLVCSLKLLMLCSHTVRACLRVYILIWQADCCKYVNTGYVERGRENNFF